LLRLPLLSHAPKLSHPHFLPILPRTLPGTRDAAAERLKRAASTVASRIESFMRMFNGANRNRGATRGSSRHAEDTDRRDHLLPLCGWGLRAGWMAQELMHTFAEELGTVMLTPDTTGGVFEVRVDGALVFSRKETGHIPEIKELKRLVRDHIAPDRSLGHVDRN
jgi:selenoprotein W-related protein